ncbi:MAG: nuclear transport factor 2 family protein [Muricomes sp.]|uniref:nuclear transport factor 2 family protein n=1 Tax=Faecalicatena contorta TaxID=39482 RepID=UPI002EB747BA|nr:nuclear transport factor 2 family protein [Muricomes sp.]
MSWEQDYAEIKSGFEAFVKAWETREVDALDNLMIVNPFVSYSIFDPIYSREILKERMKVLGKQPTYSRFVIKSYVCKIENGKAQQSAGMIGYFGDDSGKEYTHYAFTGYFTNSWEKFEDGWKIINAKFDLITDDGTMGMRNEAGDFIRVKGEGDLAFVPNWNPICDDKSVFDGCHLPCINGDTDAPWLVIKNPENKPLTDEEEIQELLNRYTFMIDTDTYALLPDLFTEDCSVSMSQLGEMTYPTAIRMLKQMSGGAIRCHHMGEIVKLDVDGDRAVATAYRRAADEMYPFKYTKETEKVDFVAARYTLMFRRDHGKWRISHMAYYPGTFINGIYE